MEREEQKQNLFKQLLLRNQINAQIIRKYCRKSSNYHKRIAKSISNIYNSETSATQHTVQFQSNTKQSNSQNAMQKQHCSISQLVTDNLFQTHEVQKIENGQVNSNILAQEKQYYEQHMQCENNNSFKEKCNIKLPAIVNTKQNNVGGQGKKNFGIKTQVSMSIGSGISCQKRSKASTQTTQPCRYNEPAPQMEQKPIKQLWKPNPQVYTQNIVQNSIHRKEYSSSHKALLNLQQITFDDKKKSDKSRMKVYHKQLEKAKQRDKQKQKITSKEKITDKENILNICYNFNHDDNKKLASLDGLQGLARVLGHSNLSNAQFESISISALSYAKGAMARNSTQAITTAPADQQSQKPQKNQNLPQIRRVKQLRFNIYRSRKQQTNNYSSIRHCHNSVSNMKAIDAINTHGYSDMNLNGGANGSGSFHNHSYSSGVAEVLTIPQLNSNVFRIEAVPVHQIKWM